ELDVVLLEMLLRAPQALVEASERRAAVSGDEACGIEPGGLVAHPLQHHQPDERLRAREERASVGDGVLVVEGGLGELQGRVHGYPLDSTARFDSRLRARAR